jgi:hypothetical protein
LCSHDRCSRCRWSGCWSPLAGGYALATGQPVSDVLFSGQTDLGALISNGANYSAGTLLLILLCKGIAYALALAGFRGGPVFPAMFLGAVMGIALSHLPGLPLIAGVAIGIGAMCVVMLRLPLTSVLLATLLERVSFDEFAVADHGAGEGEEGEEVVSVPVVASDQAAVAANPGQAAFDDPALSAEALG